jgi:23S rRNA (guanosine2251-2'-O)-methyltransferase
MTKPRSHFRDAPQNRSSGRYWLYGKHAVISALSAASLNRRRFYQLFVTEKAGEELRSKVDISGLEVRPQIVPTTQIAQVLGQGPSSETVHQGYALQVSNLETYDIAWLLKQVSEKETCRLVILDQLTDPHNVGAIIRSAACFGADAVITTKNNAVYDSPVVAKSSSGMVDQLPIVTVTNLVRSLEELKKEGVWVAGLAGNAKDHISSLKKFEKAAIVLGSEGKGMRSLTEKHCDLMLSIPIAPIVDSLNVSNAAAIALYELSR